MAIKKLNQHELQAALSNRRVGQAAYEILTGSANVGTVATTGNTVVEQGVGHMKKTVITMTATSFTLTDEAGVGQYGGFKVYDMPAGNIMIFGASLDAAITTTSPFIATAAGDVGVGTSAVDDGNALATTEQDIIPTTAIAAMVGNTGPIDCQSTETEFAVHDGTSTAKDVYVNVRIDDNAAHATTAGQTITGTLTLHWMNLGDI